MITNDMVLCVDVRTKHRLTQDQLATFIGVNRMTISRYERGEAAVPSPMRLLFYLLATMPPKKFEALKYAKVLR